MFNSVVWDFSACYINSRQTFENELSGRHIFIYPIEHPLCDCILGKELGSTDSFSSPLSVEVTSPMARAQPLPRTGAVSCTVGRGTHGCLSRSCVSLVADEPVQMEVMDDWMEPAEEPHYRCHAQSWDRWRAIPPWYVVWKHAQDRRSLHVCVCVNNAPTSPHGDRNSDQATDVARALFRSILLNAFKACRLSHTTNVHVLHVVDRWLN